MRKLLVREVDCNDFDLDSYFDFKYDLDKDFIIHGNRDFKSYHEDLLLEIDRNFENIAYEWKHDQQAYLRYYDNIKQYLNDFLPKEEGRYTDSEVAEMLDLFERYDVNYKVMYDNEFLAEILSVLKGKKMIHKCMCGYSQGDWQDCYFSEELAPDFKTIEAYYFGMCCELEIVEADTNDVDYSENIEDYYDRDMVECTCWINDYDLLSEVAKVYDIPREDIMYYEISGYVKTPVYKLA